MKHLNRNLFMGLLVPYSVIVWIVSALISSVKLSELWELLKLLPNVVTADAILLWFFIKWGWKYKRLQGWLVPFPNLNGTWQGTIKSSWINPETHEAIQAIPVILTINQSFISISCVMRTREMTSFSYSSEFVIDVDAQIKKLVYTYRSCPKPAVTDRSNMHDGAIVFEIIGNPPKKLRGEYWTSRKTIGEIELTFRTREKLQELSKDM